MLVVGSLPGEASLAAQRYYAHPQNQFWHLAGHVIGDAALPDREYDDRLAALLAAGIGLWDTVRSGKRTGSLDSALRSVEGNALADLAAGLPDLKAVGFNGATSAKIGAPMLAATDLALLALPSSSAAHARMTRAEKAAEWAALSPFLARSGLQSPGQCPDSSRQ